MKEMIDIVLSRDRKSTMIGVASQQFSESLSLVTPPFDTSRDVVRLKRCVSRSNQIRLTYEITRNARPSREDQNRSPYREKES